jgi:hypothetical protein
MMNQMLLQLDNLIEGTVIKRPSKIIKSPYVADIVLENNGMINEILVILHHLVVVVCLT